MILCHFSIFIKIYKERVIVIIPITKDEAQRLNKEYGVKFGSYGISSTHTKHKKFFLTESKNNLDALNEIRGLCLAKINLTLGIRELVSD